MGEFERRPVFPKSESPQCPPSVPTPPVPRSTSRDSAFADSLSIS